MRITSLDIQFVCHLSNHSPCFDVLSESSSVILHSTNKALINTTIPHRPISQHLTPFPHRTKLYRHQLSAFSLHLRVSQRRRLSVTQFLPHPFGNFIIPQKYLRTYPQTVTISVGASLHPSATSPMSRPLLSLTLTSFITSVRQTSFTVVLIVACSFANPSGQSRFSPIRCTNSLNCGDSCARHPPVAQKVLGSLLQGQFDVQNCLVPSIFQLLSLLST